MCNKQIPKRFWGFFSDMESFVQAKRFLLMQHAVAPPTALAGVRRRLLFDLGASTYDGWLGGHDAVGSKWFVAQLAAFQLSFDHIYAYELQPHTRAEIEANMPADILAKYTYINSGVSAVVGAADNPWTTLLAQAAVDDYVVVKLDIDTPAIEQALFDQVRHDASVRQLIDEMFYEHHVNCKVMNPYWNLWHSQDRLFHTYEMFLAMRHTGLRMHSWP
jgi:hypothetical protein